MNPLQICRLLALIDLLEIYLKVLVILWKLQIHHFQVFAAYIYACHARTTWCDRWVHPPELEPRHWAEASPRACGSWCMFASGPCEGWPRSLRLNRKQFVAAHWDGMATQWHCRPCVGCKRFSVRRVAASIAGAFESHKVCHKQAAAWLPAYLTPTKLNAPTLSRQPHFPPSLPSIFTSRCASPAKSSWGLSSLASLTSSDKWDNALVHWHPKPEALAGNSTIAGAHSLSAAHALQCGNGNESAQSQKTSLRICYCSSCVGQL